MTVEQVFTNVKETENGDLAFKSTCNKMLDILFMTEYYQKHLDEIPYLGSSDENRLFAMFIRDPRYGLGKRDIGRVLMSRAECRLEEVVKCGRIDDLF